MFSPVNVLVQVTDPYNLQDACAITFACDSCEAEVPLSELDIHKCETKQVSLPCFLSGCNIICVSNELSVVVTLSLEFATGC